MAEIGLTMGYVAIVDDSDYEYINSFKWTARSKSNTVYAWRRGIVDGEYKNIHMHRVILDADKYGLRVDHIDGNGLNNTRQNLRLCTQSENSRNKRTKPHSSLYKGVCKLSNGKFRSAIRVDGKAIHLGYNTDEIKAAKLYDLAAMKYFGEFAMLNNYK